MSCFRFGTCSRRGQFGGDSQNQALAVIQRNVKALSQLVGDVLDVSSIVRGKVRLNLVASDLSTVVGAAVDIVRPAAEAKGVTLAFEPPAARFTIRSDADRLQQVFWNLLSNAVKFTPRGGRIDVSVTTADDVAEVRVKDTGIGIRPEVLPYVFQRFWQGENGSGRVAGLGLGLALARHFVELHGGNISVASEGWGRGATFTVSLPLQEVGG